MLPSLYPFYPFSRRMHILPVLSQLLMSPFVNFPLLSFFLATAEPRISWQECKARGNIVWAARIWKATVQNKVMWHLATETGGKKIGSLIACQDLGKPQMIAKWKRRVLAVGEKVADRFLQCSYIFSGLDQKMEMRNCPAHLDSFHSRTWRP